MKARRVKGLDPGGPLSDNLARIVLVRLDELHSFMPQAADPQEVVALHDLRIAAKRLRYILEVSAGCFGDYAAVATKRAKQIQDLVGEIHDCDVTLPRIDALLAETRAADVTAVRGRAAGHAEDLDPALAAGAPHADAYRGLATLATFQIARREVLFARFLELWDALEQERFRARLHEALHERPAVTRDSPADHAEVVPSEQDDRPA